MTSLTLVRCPNLPSLIQDSGLAHQPHAGNDVRTDIERTPSADGGGTVAVALAALGGALLGVAVLVILLFATLYLQYRRALRPHLVAELVRLSGPSIVHALPPHEVMTALLSKIYGHSDANHDVIVGVLGGECVEPHGGDLTVSTRSTVNLELRAIDHDTYELVSTVTYTFKNIVPDHRFVIFAMCDPLLRDSIALACRRRSTMHGSCLTNGFSIRRSTKCYRLLVAVMK